MTSFKVVVATRAMKQMTIGVIAIVASTLVGALPAQAMLRDQATTREFILLETHDVKLEPTEFKASKAAMAAFIARTAAGCSGLVPSGLLNGTGIGAQQAVAISLLLEGTMDLATAATQPIRNVARTDILQLARLRWTSPKVERAVAAEISTDRQALAARPSHLCADITNAKASGFAAIPAATRTLIDQLGPDNAPTLVQFLNDLRPYVTTGDATAYVRLKKLAASQERNENMAANTCVNRLQSVILGP